MATAALVIALIGSSITVAGQGLDFWRQVVVKPTVAVHHHTTRPLYRHVLRPIGKELTK